MNLVKTFREKSIVLNVNFSWMLSFAAKIVKNQTLNVRICMYQHGQ